MKSKIFPIIILVLIFGLGIFLIANKSESTESAEDDMENAALEEMPAKDEMAKLTELMVPDGAITYALDEGSTASYTVQKEFFDQPTVQVTGVTDLVSGKGWYVEESGAFGVDAMIDITGLTSDSEKRDSDILPLFSSTEARIQMLSDGSDSVVLGGAFEEEFPAMLTINGVTKEVMFNVVGNLSADEFDATGTATVMFSDFNMSAPSLLNVFQVGDEIELSFDVSGTMMEMDDMSDDMGADDMMDDGTEDEMVDDMDDMEGKTVEDMEDSVY